MWPRQRGHFKKPAYVFAVNYENLFVVRCAARKDIFNNYKKDIFYEFIYL